MARKQTKARRGRGRKSNRKTRRNGRKMMRGGIFGIPDLGFKKGISGLISRTVKSAITLNPADFNNKFSAVRVVGPYAVYRISNSVGNENSVIKFDFSPVYSPNKTIKQSQLFSNKQKIIDSLNDLSTKLSSNNTTNPTNPTNPAIDKVLKSVTDSKNGLEMMEKLKELKFDVPAGKRNAVISLLTTKDTNKNMLFSLDSEYIDNPTGNSDIDSSTTSPN